jgi:hypothetical protein
MREDRRRATWMGALLGALTAVLALALQARASDWQGSETEEFHESYPISANGQIELRNINGPVEIKAWDRNEVKVDAIKRGWSKERLQNRDFLTVANVYIFFGRVPAGADARRSTNQVSTPCIPGPECESRACWP